MNHILRAATATQILLAVVFSATTAALAEPSDAPTDPQFKSIMTPAIEKANQGDLAGALPAFEEALKYARRKGLPSEEAKALFNIGLLNYNLKKYAEAINQLRRAVEVRESAKLPKGSGDAELQLAIIYEEQGEKALAREYYLRALSLLEPKRRAPYWGKLARLAHEDGDNSKALEYLRHGIDSYHDAGNRSGEANLLALRHIIEDALGQPLASLATSKKILVLLDSIANPKEVGFPLEARKAMSMLAIASDLKRLGRLSEAVKELQEVRSFAREKSLPQQEAAATIMLAEACESSNPAMALGYYREASKLLRAAGDSDRDVSVLVRQAQIASLQDNHLQACALLGEAIEQAKKARDPDLLPQAQTKLAKEFLYHPETAPDPKNNETAIARAIALFEKAEKHWQDRLPIAGGQRDLISLQYAGLTFSLSSAYWREHRLPDVRSQSVLAEKVADMPNTHHNVRLFALKVAGVIAESMSGDHRRALALYERALSAAQDAQDTQSRAELLTDIGDVHARMGSVDAALKRYMEAIGLWEGLRGEAGPREVEAGLVVTAADSYEAAAELLQRQGRVSEAFGIVQRAQLHKRLGRYDVPQEGASLSTGLSSPKGAELTNRLTELLRRRGSMGDSEGKSAEEEMEDIQWRLADIALRERLHEKTMQMSSSPVGVDELRSGLGADTTLLFYFVARDRTLAFAVSRDRSRIVELSIGSAALAENVVLLHGAQWRKAAKTLYDALVVPLQKEIATPIVALAATGPLSRLSFAMLTNDGHSYFGDQHVLFYPAAISELMKSSSRLPRKPRMFSVSNRDAGPAFVELRNADREATTIARIYGRKAITDATETQVRTGITGVEILHVSAHAEASAENPAVSRILLKADKANDGLLFVGEIEGLDLHGIDLVSLSACETAQSDGRVDNDSDPVTLDRAFIDAGAKSVVATLWQVSDDTSAALMLSFYKHLHEGKSKARALQMAQREARAASSDTQDWAAFVLRGQPGTEQ
jgi:tetratricopeptide (TPR) repeat protein